MSRTGGGTIPERIVIAANMAQPQSSASMPNRLRLFVHTAECHNGSWLLDGFCFVRGGVGHATRWATEFPVNPVAESTDNRRNYPRRVLGAVLCLSPLLLLIASAVLHNRPHSAAAMWLLVPAAAFALLNFHLSVSRPLLYRLCHGSLDDFRFVSVFPIIGTVFAIIGGIVGFGALSAALIGIGAILVDTGGSFWFLVATWRDTSLWDA